MSEIKIVDLKELQVGDRFITAKDYKKRTPTWKVIGKPEFNFRHGSATRECKNEVTRQSESKSGRLKVIKLESK